jgi:hypothetical protein
MKLFGKSFKDTSFICMLFTFLVIIALNQSSMLDFALHTYLGRTLFIIILIFITSANKLCGLLVVISIIVIYNNKVQLEGFTEKERKTIKKVIKTPSTTVAPDNEAEIKDDAVDIKEKATVEVDAVDEETLKKQITSLVKNIKKNKPKEGFCMSDRESTLLRGKQPNSVVLNDSRKQPDHVSPSDDTDFVSGPSPF